MVIWVIDVDPLGPYIVVLYVAIPIEYNDDDVTSSMTMVEGFVRFSTVKFVWNV